MNAAEDFFSRIASWTPGRLSDALVTALPAQWDLADGGEHPVLVLQVEQGYSAIVIAGRVQPLSMWQSVLNEADTAEELEEAANQLHSSTEGLSRGYVYCALDSATGSAHGDAHVSQLHPVTEAVLDVCAAVNYDLDALLRLVPAQDLPTLLESGSCGCIPGS